MKMFFLLLIFLSNTFDKVVSFSFITFNFITGFIATLTSQFQTRFFRRFKLANKEIWKADGIN